MARPHALSRGVRLPSISVEVGRAARRRRARPARMTVSDARNCRRGVYGAVTLFTGDVVFDGIGMLQAGEFDGEAVFDVTDHPARGLADGDG